MSVIPRISVTEEGYERLYYPRRNKWDIRSKVNDICSLPIN